MNKMNENIDYNVVLEKLQNYMINEKNFTNNENSKGASVPASASLVSVASLAKPFVPEFFIPKQKDTLFWSFYIMKNGLDKYKELDYINIVVEKQLKIEYIEKLRKEKQLIKTYKYASMTHIENQLLNEQKIDIKTFFTLCVLENLNIFYLNKKTYYELLMNDTTTYHVVKLNESGKYGHKIESDINNINKYRTSLFQIENIEKPIKSLSAYKISELVEYCSKLDISIVNETTAKKKNKNELYESIIKYF